MGLDGNDPLRSWFGNCVPVFPSDKKYLARISVLPRARRRASIILTERLSLTRRPPIPAVLALILKDHPGQMVMVVKILKPQRP